ncbi:MAG: hypothetical protein AB1422_15460 [bacterium]
MNYISKDDKEITSFNLYMFTDTPISLVNKDGVKKANFPLPPGEMYILLQKIMLKEH